MKRIIAWAFFLCATGMLVPQSASADIMNLNLAGVDARYQQVFRDAERFWETRITGYSRTLPSIVRSQLSKINIVAVTAAIDGPGGVLGSAGPTATFSYQSIGKNGVPGRRYTFATASQMQFDIDDIVQLDAEGTLENVVRHEMAHALGFGSLWTQNDLLSPVGQYIGAEGLKKFRTEARRTGAGFVPVEQRGGGGTAGAHWDALDPFFNPIGGPDISDLMVGFLDADTTPDGADTKFVSETTWASFVDLGFHVAGISKEGGVIIVPPRGNGFPKWAGPGTPIFMTDSYRGSSAIPEPSSLFALAGLVAGLVACSRRRSA